MAKSMKGINTRSGGTPSKDVIKIMPFAPASKTSDVGKAIAKRAMDANGKSKADSKTLWDESFNQMSKAKKARNK